MSTTPRCRACSNSRLRLGFDLGFLPLANSFLTAQRARDPTPEPTYPLRIFYCTDCGLIQLLDMVDRKEMFDDYAFLTATAVTSMVHFDQYAEELTERLLLNSGDLVVDIGSNDGTLLKAFMLRGASVLGIEPARNIASLAVAEGVPTLNEYFGAKTLERIGRSKARIITANNVVSHVSDLNDFVESVAKLLAPGGLFAFEVPWVVDVLRHYNFDLVYHEHLSYFGFKPLSVVLDRHGLELVGLEHFPGIHGGTLRGIAAHHNSFSKRLEELDRTFHDEENGADFQSLEEFARHVEELKVKLVRLLKTLKK